MNNESFRALVTRMRDKQKQYFRTRDSYVLNESKALEREVDTELASTGQKELPGFNAFVAANPSIPAEGLPF